MLAVVAAEAGTASEVQDETAAVHREMASLGPESASDVIAIIPQIWISRSVHVRLSMTGVANSFRGLYPVTPNMAAFELWAAAGRARIAFGSTGLSVQFPSPRHLALTRHTSLMPRARSSGQFRRQREAT